MDSCLSVLGDISRYHAGEMEPNRMRISESDAWDNWAALQAVTSSARQYLDRLAKARRPDEDREDVPERHGVLHQEGYGGDGAAQPRGIPRHRPTQSSGRGGEEMSAESDFRAGDATTEAAHRFSRELSAMKATMKALQNELQDILDEEPEPEPNQRDWPTQDVSQADVLAGRAMHRGTVSDLLGVIGGRGKSLPIERLMKRASAIGARIEMAADAGDLTLNEELAASSILGMIPMAIQDENYVAALAERLAACEPHVRALFGI